jgi:replicative DNA helicase
VTTHAENVIYSRLNDVDTLEYLVRENFDPGLLTTDLMRPVVTWALDEYLRSGCLQAPSREALEATWEKALEDAEIELEPEDVEIDTAEWAVGWLRSQRVHSESQKFNKKLAEAMYNADVPDRVKVLQEYSAELMTMSLNVSSQMHNMNLDEGVRQALRRFDARRASGISIRGLRLAYPEIDEHTCGIQDGELAVLAAGPKTGKSYFLARAALEEYRISRRTVLFTLENGVDMTVDRLICLAQGVDYRSFQRGTCTPEETERVRDFESDLARAGGMLQIIKPGRGERTAAQMVKQAQVLNADSLLIDQLTFIEHPDPARKPKHQIIGEIMHDLKDYISTGRHTMPCLLAHQINREGVKMAEKEDHLAMWMLAESSEVERTADWVFGLYASQMERISGQAKLQILAARREIVRNWAITWRNGVGFSQVLRELDLAA